MAKFTQLNPREVMIGRERAAIEARRPYQEALEASDAGQIELARGDVPSTVKRRLADAAKDMGVRVRSSWTDPKQRVLVWKKTGRSAAPRARRGSANGASHR